MRIKSMMKGMLAVVMAMSMAASDYVQKGIGVLDNDTGFFMMCEGGKIDWAFHANDVGTKRKEFQYIPFGDDVMDEFGRFQPSPGRFPSSKSILLLKEHFLPQTWWQIRPRSADGIRICME